MATTTINTTGPEDARLIVAFGRRLRLGRNATQAEIVADLRRYLTSVVLDEERQVAAESAIAAVAPIVPT